MAKKSRKVFATTATAALVASAVAPIASSAAGFSDVTKPEYKTAIDALAEAGILNGYENGTFKPENKVTRGEVAKVITLIRHLEEGTKTPFKDVKDGYWSTPYINSLYAAKLINGYENGTFKPEGNITRAEFAKLVVDAYGLTLTNAATPFTDVKAGNWATPYIQTAYANGLIKGVTASKFDPSAPIKRGDLAILLHRADSKFGDVIGNNFPGVELVKATNNTTVEVTFKNEVDAKDVQAAKFSIEGLTVSNAAVKQTDNKTVVLTTSAQEGGKQYTVKSGSATLGKFIGASAVVPKSIKVTTPSVQGTIGKEVTLKAEVTVEDGKSKAGIPVTFNIVNSDPNVNSKVEVEALTDENGVASYSYTRYYASEDSVTAYATSKSSVFSKGKVYWANAAQLTLKDVSGVNKLANNDSKVYEISSAKNANKYVFVTFKENLNTTADKIVRTVGAKGSTAYYLTGTNAVNTTGAAAEYPYEITTGSKAVIAVKLDPNGKANLVLTGANATVTPIVYEGVAVDGNDTGNVAGDTLSEFTDASYNELALQATAPALTFDAKQVLGLTIEAQGVANAATYKGTSETGGRDYVVTYVDKDGKPAKAGSPVQIAIPVQKASDEVFLINADGTKDLGTKSGDYRVFNKTVSGKEGKVKFTVGSENITQYVEPIVFVDNGTGIGAKAGLDSTDLQAKGAATHFTDVVTYSTSLTLVDANGDEIKQVLANGIEKAYFEYATVDQNGKARAYRLADGKTAETTLTYTVHAGTSPVTVVNGVGQANKVVSAGGTGTFNLVIPAGKSSGALEVIATAPTTATVSATASVAGLVLGSTEPVTATFANTSVVNVTGTVTEVNKTTSIVKIDGVPYDLAGATYLHEGTVVPTLSAFYDHLTVGKKVSVTKDADGKLVFNVTGKATQDVVNAVNSASSAAQVNVALNSYKEFNSLPTAIQTRIASAINTALGNGTVFTAASLDTTYTAEYKNAVIAEIGEVVGGTASAVKAGATAANWTAFVDSIKDIPGSSSVVTKLGAINDTDVQEAIATNVDTYVTSLTSSATAEQHAAEFVAAVNSAIEGSTTSVALSAVNSALSNVGAPSAQQIADAKKALTDNAKTLGLNLTEFNKLDAADQDAVVTKLFVDPTASYTQASLQAKINTEVAIAADVEAPTITKAEFNADTQEITFTFSEAVNIGTSSAGTITFTDLPGTTATPAVGTAQNNVTSYKATLSSAVTDGLKVGSKITTITNFDVKDKAGNSLKLTGLNITVVAAK